MKVLHIITGLGVGGAETTLLKLLQTMDRTRFQPIVISLMSGGDLRQKIEQLGIKTYSLNMHRGLPFTKSVLLLRSIVNNENPDLIQGWMYHGNLAGLLAQKYSSRPVGLIWNVRQCIYELTTEKRLTRWLIKLGAKLSYKPDHIIYNAAMSMRQH